MRHIAARKCALAASADTPYGVAGICRQSLLLVGGALALLVAATPLNGATVSLANSSEPEKRRFVAYAWSGEPGKYDNIIPFYWLIRARLDPARAKAATDAMPVGHRVFFSWDLHNGLTRHAEDYCRDSAGKLTHQRGIWWDQGAAEVARRFDDFFRRYGELGGKVDALILDFEEGMSNWSLRRDADRYRAIANDPRFPSIAGQLGFSDLTTVMNWQGQSGRAREHYRIWNALMEQRAAGYVREAVYGPARKHFPNVKMSNWEKHYNAPPFLCPDRNGYEHGHFRAGVHVGSHQSANLYCWLGQLRYKVLPGGTQPYGAGPFEGFRHSVNRMRSMVLSSNVAAWPWISHKRFRESMVRDSDLYQELIFHAGLCGPEQFLYWNPRPNRPEHKPEHYADASQDQLLSDCLHLLDELAGAADRATLVDDLAGWYDDYVLTGMRTGGRAVWRFTPKLGPNQKREDTLRVKSPATFRTQRSEIRIAGGEVYVPKSEVSEQGYWIIAPQNAKPVIKTAARRYPYE